MVTRVLLVSTFFLLLVPPQPRKSPGRRPPGSMGSPTLPPMPPVMTPTGCVPDRAGAGQERRAVRGRPQQQPHPVFRADGDTTADRVYGQHGDLASYTQNYDGVGGSGLPSADTLNFPVAISLAADDGLYVTDRENHRVLYYAPDGDTTADRVYGQFGSFTTNPPNNDGLGGTALPSAENIGVFALGVLADQSGLYVSDSSNNRVLYFAPGAIPPPTTSTGSLGTSPAGSRIMTAADRRECPAPKA